jgi:hypothetical protein
MQVTHQTVRLGKGKHSSPEHGACVMELASMLAGEPFTDHPQSVSRPLAAFLRTYNDMLDDTRRQDLYAYAAKAVGTAGSPEADRVGVERLLAWADSARKRRLSMPPLPWSKRRRSRTVSDPEGAARYAIRSIGKLTDETHALVLALVDELIAIGERSGLVTAANELAPHHACERVTELGGVK